MSRPWRRVIVGALSADGFAGRRKACMETWGEFLPLFEGQVEVVFVRGRPHLQEPVRHGWNLFLPCPDTYDNLSTKTKWFCQWALDNYSFQYLLKCDDDTYVDLDRLLRVPAGMDYAGCAIRGGMDYFCSGGAGYLLSQRAAKMVSHHLMDRMSFEDLMIGRALRQAGITPTFLSEFVPGNHQGPEPGNQFITSHYCEPAAMYQRHALRYPAGTDLPA